MAEKKIHSSNFEINLVHHCNLSCKSCSHLSPVQSKSFVDAEKLLFSLEMLARFYQSDRIRILGGEPLLHPDLSEIIQGIRGTGIASEIQVITNGLLLPKMNYEFWKNVNAVTVSVYPGREMSETSMIQCQEWAKKYRVKLETKYISEFRISYSELGPLDEKLIKRIYLSCLPAHRWFCHTIEAGYFYKCPQSFLIYRMLHRGSVAHNGIKIEDHPSFSGRLQDYLDDIEPLAACRNCLGSVGKSFAHEEVSRKQWRIPQSQPTEDLLDQKYLEILEILMSHEKSVSKSFNLALS